VNNNSYKFRLSDTQKFLDIPVEIQWDYLGVEDGISQYEEGVVKDIIGSADDFEVFRFAHKEYGQKQKTELKYSFNFYSGNTSVSASTVNNWVSTYYGSVFNYNQLVYKQKPFIKSFYKLDFYDTMDESQQTNYFTVILPIINGGLEEIIGSTTQKSMVNTPYFIMDYLKNKEGFFIYWLRKKTFIDIDTFYMGVKFFDASLGVFVKMMTVPQATLPNKFQFNNNLFYVKTVLDYSNRTYSLYDTATNNRIGEGNPINWFEYVNA